MYMANDALEYDKRGPLVLIRQIRDMINQQNGEFLKLRFVLTAEFWVVESPDSLHYCG